MNNKVNPFLKKYLIVNSVFIVVESYVIFMSPQEKFEQVEEIKKCISTNVDSKLCDYNSGYINGEFMASAAVYTLLLFGAIWIFTKFKGKSST